MSDQDLEAELNSAFVSPDRYFKDQRLAPYTEGSRLLLLQVRDDADSSIYFIWSFLFVHILLAKDRKAAIRLAWNKDEFREKLMEWSEDMTPEDRDTAGLLVAAILGEANKSRVAVIPDKKPIGDPGNA
jgi:hypothetical protein